MKTLTLVRHAKSSWSDASATDHQRTLNSRGEHDAPMMGERLAAQPLPDTILCSDARRARQTAHLLVPAMGMSMSDVKLESRIYEASTQALIEVIADVEESTDSLMLIGHNPGLESLCELLLPGSIPAMATCAVCRIELDTTHWADLIAVPTRLVFHDFPKKPR